MCGIVGYVNWHKNVSVIKSDLEKMTQTLEHRGPDESGHYFSEHVAFGHRRLSVISIADGQQPMTCWHKGRCYVINYNGELYNFKHLRKELEAAGHFFNTNSDTEVFLHAYIRWGVDAFERMQGIFSAAIYDEERKEVILIRDHLGVKPLFYSVLGDALIFSSEIKSLLQYPDIEPKVTAKGLVSFLITPPYIPGRSVYKDIYELRPGTFLKHNKEGVEEKTYWCLSYSEHKDSEQQTIEKVRSLITERVRSQLVADEPVTALLSGGIDSSIIALIAKQELGYLRTYCLGYEGSTAASTKSLIHADPDVPWADKVATYLGTHHKSMSFSADELYQNRMIPTRANDLPSMGQLETSLYCLAKEIKKAGPVVLSGEGADEIFDGYPWVNLPASDNPDTFPWITAGLPSFNLDLLSESITRQVDAKEYLADCYKKAVQSMPSMAGEDQGEQRKRLFSYLNISYLLPMLLTRKDRQGMAAGLEIRVPYCDPTLVQYVWNIPSAIKQFGGQPKGLLRQAFSDSLPEDVIKRKKTAYPFFVDPSYIEKLQKLVGSFIQRKDLVLWEIIDKKMISRFLESPSKKINPMQLTMLLDRIVQINIWLNEYAVELD